ncbi:putative UPF0676 protein, partial [Cardiosporidium cionae]
LKSDIEEISRDGGGTECSTPPVKDSTQTEFEKFGHALKDIGFFQIINHGIDFELINSVMQCSHRFFELPTEIKRSIQMKEDVNRGYFGYMDENLDDNNAVKSYIGDIKEGYDMGIELPFPDFTPYMPVLGWHKGNQWLDSELVPEFRKIMLAYIHQMMKLARQLASFMAIVIGCDSKCFGEFFLSPIINLRILHYPPNLDRLNSLNENFREAYCSCAPHTDYGCCTLLLQDACGGLEILAPDGTFISCPPIEGAFVINIGDMMARWSSGLLKSTVHRVVRTKESIAMDRYSVPFFFSPSPHVSLVPLVAPPTKTEGKKSMETDAMAAKAFTCEEWLNKRYNRSFTALHSESRS